MDPNYFSILHENMSPNFFWEPPGLRKWHYLQKFPREKVVTHLKIFLRVIQNFWHGRNACDKKKSGYCLRTSVTSYCSPIIRKKLNWHDFHNLLFRNFLWLFLFKFCTELWLWHQDKKQKMNIFFVDIVCRERVSTSTHIFNRTRKTIFYLIEMVSSK